MRQPALPERPEFPVYGFSGSFTGERWLEGWDGLLGVDFGLPGNRLWQVQLGHGDPRRLAPLSIVTTDAKLPAAEVGDGTWLGPTGVTDAATITQLDAVSVEFSDNSIELEAESNKANRLARRLDAPEWVETVATVDGTATFFLLRRIGRGWVAVADVGEVALGIYGRGIALGEYPLEPITDLPFQN